MSGAYPVIWAMKHAPVADALERLVLIAMADASDSDGCNSYRSIATHMLIATGIDKSTIIRRQRAMERRGLIRRDTSPPPARYLKIRADNRPARWELCIPYSWWSDAQREAVQRDREDRGLPPITPESRPDLPDAPGKKTRADKGQPNPKRGRKKKHDEAPPLQEEAPADEGAEERGVFKTPRELIESEERGVSETPRGVSSRHLAGCLEDTQPSWGDPPLKPSPSYLAEPQSSQKSPGDFRNEGEEEIPRTPTSTPPAVVEVPVLEGRRAAAAELVMSLPWQRQPSTVQRKRLIDLVDVAWSAGWTSEALQAELVAELGGARSLFAVWQKRLQELPAPRRGEDDAARPTMPPKCDDPSCGPDRLIQVDEDSVRRCPRCYPGVATTAEGDPR